MKNLKKALSMVLASAMLFGMMVVGTGAAHSDVKAEHNTEAIAVVTAAGIMGAGDSFNPDAELTRGEMAVIMTNMLDLDVADYKGSANFTDAGWAADYIDACYANGIMAGVSATEFGTNVKVTTAQAALMMLKALGYFEEAKLNDWMLDTVKMAAKIDLLDGIDAKASANLTRNEVAQLALNALEATCVEETANGANTSIKGEGFEISVDSTVSRVDLLTSYNYNAATPDANGKTTMQLIEKLYGNDFTKTTSGVYTALKQPAYVWADTTKIVSEQEIIKVAEAPKYTIVIDDTTGVTSALTLYQEFIDEDADATVFAGTVDYKKVTDASWAGATYAVGDVVELYTNANGKIDAVVAITYSLGQVDKISTALSKQDKEDGNTCKITVKAFNANATQGATIFAGLLDGDFAGFDYEEDDVILYVYDGTKVVASKLAETVEGEVTKVINGGKRVIDGETVKLIAGTANLGDKGTFYLNAAGQIVAADTTAAKSEDYAYIYSVKAPSGTNAAGLPNTIFTAYMILEDGTQVSYPIAATADCALNASLNNAAFTGVVAYAINGDGQLENKAAVNTPVEVINDAVDKNDAKIGVNYADAATEFIFVDVQATKVKTSVVTGYKNVSVATVADPTDPLTPPAHIWTVAKDGKILTAFVIAPNGSLASDVEYAVVLDNDYFNTKDSDNNTYTTINTNDGALTFKNTNATAAQALVKGTLFSYKMVDGYAQVQGTTAVMADLAAGFEVAANKVTAITEDYIVVNNGAQVALNDKIEYFTVTVEYDAVVRTEIESVIVSKGADIAKDDFVAVIMDGTDIAAIYVLEVIE